MNNILDAYYNGIMLQLQSEVKFINSLFNHQGLKGLGNETIIKDLLIKFTLKDTVLALE